MAFLTATRAGIVVAAVALTLGAGCATDAPRATNAELARQVADTERAFARTMAERNHAAFTTLIAEEAIFVSESRTLHGKAEVAAAWKRFFEAPAAPFSWEPGEVEVLPSGTLALSTGPVRSPEGKVLATFTSIWRQDSPGVWRIVFDRGNDVCDCPKP